MSTQTKQEYVNTEAGFYNVATADKEKNLQASNKLNYSDLVLSLNNTFKSGKTKDLKWRKQQLEQLKRLISENHEKISEALLKDHAGPKVRAAFDLSAYGAADYAIDNLDTWAAPQTVKHNSLLGKSYVRKEPKGVVLLISPWNYPFAMVFDALVGILAAGNCVLIKPSEVSENSCQCIAELVPKYFDNAAVKVVTGGVAETTALLREKFDHIMYTGNGAVGRIVMAAAAKHLTPVTLELGGKSPVYVDKSAKISTAVARIGAAKWINVGQTCIAPDYILVHEAVADEFRTKLLEQVNKQYGDSSDSRKGNKDYARVINSRHVSRINNLVASTKGKVLVGGKSDEADRFFDATVVENPSLDDPLMKEEIFGPVLPIMKVKSVEEAVEKVSKICEKPLALYIFAEEQKSIDYFLNNTNSGGVCVNSALEHIATNYLPFGGVGESGMGHYHGVWGFNEFTHFRSVLVKDTMFIRGPFLPPPPYKDSLYDLIVKLSITGFLTEGQRKGLKAAALIAALGIGYKVMKSRL